MKLMQGEVRGQSMLPLGSDNSYSAVAQSLTAADRVTELVPAHYDRAFQFPIGSRYYDNKIEEIHAPYSITHT